MGRKIKGVRTNVGWKIFMAALMFVLMQGMLKSCQMSKREMTEGQASLGKVLIGTFAEEITGTLYGQFVSMYAFDTESQSGSHWLVQVQIEGLLPFYEYSRKGIAETIVATQEGQTNVVVSTPQTEPEDVRMSLSELLAAENEAAMKENLQSCEPVEPREAVEEQVAVEEWEMGGVQETLQGGGFVPHTQMAQVDMTLLSDYETLLRQFYTVDANTSGSSERLNVESFMEKNMTIQKEEDGPQILIFHTHSQESFIDSVPGDENTSIMGVGDRLAQILQETYGYEVLHHKGKYDVETRDDAYSKALPEIERVLKENPTIEVVIDLHRDQMPEETKLYMDLDGRPTARFMFFNGLSRTKKTGNISYLHNENLDHNLAFSFQMQKKAMEYYPGLTRKIYLKGYRYNMHLAQKYLLVEMGAQNNTVEEAMNACDPLAHILDLVLTGR